MFYHGPGGGELAVCIIFYPLTPPRPPPTLVWPRGPGMKMAFLLAPHLPVQVERGRHPDLDGRPLVVGGQPWDPGAVLDCCPLAESIGVRPGMRLSRAEALCPTAGFLPADEPLYHAVHQALEAALRQFTDRVETCGLGRFLADVRGLEQGSNSAWIKDAGSGHHPSYAPRTSPATGSEHRLARRLASAASQATGLDVRLGLATDRFTAEQAAHAARSGGWYVVLPGQEGAFLAPLPLSALPADAEFLRRLHLLGISTLGALAALPRLALIHQFGPQAGLLYDLATGHDPRPVCPDAPPLVVDGAYAFEPPVAGRDALLAQTGQILAVLGRDLARRGYQAEGLKMRLEDQAGEAHLAAAPVKPPTADPERLVRRAKALLERLNPRYPVCDLVITLYPLRLAYLGATQLALFGRVTDSRHDHLRETLRRLRERFGEMVVVIASLLGPPAPQPIQVTTDAEGIPRALIWPDRILPLVRVYEHWRERRYWWARPVLRDYYRVETANGQVKAIFRDREGGGWWLERRSI